MADDINKVIPTIETRLERITSEYSKTNEFKKLGELIAEQIRKRTRLGKGVDDSGNQQALQKLTSDPYKDFRKRYKDRLSNETSPGKSNLTATGQLLDAIDSKTTKDSIVIFFKTKRSFELNGSRSRVSNDKLARYVQEQGRPFFRLSKTEEQKFTRQIRNDILKLIKKK